VTNAVIEDISWFPSDKPLCGSESRQLTGASTANATTFSWSKSGGTSIVGPSNQSTVTVQGSSNGYLTLTASNACGTSKNRTQRIYANTPQIPSTDVLVDGHPNYYPNYTSGSSYINIVNGSSCQTYKWSLFGGSGSYYATGSCSYCGNNFNGINFNQCGTGSASTSSSMALKLQSANRCGQGVDVIIPLEVSGGGGYYYRLASPNPGKQWVSIEFDPVQAKNDLNMLRIISHNRSNIVRNFDINQAKKNNYFDTNDTVSFDVNNLPRGVYHVIMKFGAKNETYTEMIILE
jgi:hypothetical protein